MLVLVQIHDTREVCLLQPWQHCVVLSWDDDSCIHLRSYRRTGLRHNKMDRVLVGKYLTAPLQRLRALRTICRP